MQNNILHLRHALIVNNQNEFDRALAIMDAHGYDNYAILLSNKELSIVKSWNSGWIEDNSSYKGHKIILKESLNAK